MFTYAQVQVAAFTSEHGGVFHADCARELFGTLTTEKAEAGLTNAYGLTPLIQYQVDEWAGEDAWNLAEELAYDFADEHPRTAALFGVANANSAGDTNDTRNRWGLIDRLADRFADIAGPTCDHCGEVIN